MNYPLIVAALIIITTLIIITYFTLFRKPKKLQKLWEQIQGGETKNSIRSLKTIIIKQGGSIDSHFLLAECYRREGNYQMAVVEYRFCLKIKKKPYLTTIEEIRKGLVDCYLQLNKQEESLAELLELVRINPKNYEYLFEIARIYYEKGSIEAAVTYLDKTIKYNSTHSDALGYLGMIMYHANQVTDAVGYLTKSVKYDPKNFRSYYYLGRLYMDGRDFPRAITYFEASQRSLDFKIRAFFQKGNCYREMDEYEHAVDEYEKGIASSTGKDQNLMLQIKYALASLYETRGKLAEAIEQWEGINRINPAYKDVPKKLEEYHDLRADDNMKDFLVSPLPVFEGICLEIVKHLGFDMVDLKHLKTSITAVIGTPQMSVKRNVKRQLVYFKFYRDAVTLGLNAVKNVMEEAKRMRCVTAYCFSPVKFADDAENFSMGRQLILTGGEQLADILKKIRG